MRMALSMFVFACVGTALEVVFTALADFRKTRSLRLMGYSYVWMLPIYALVPVIMDVLYVPLEGVILPLRLATYVTLLLAVEYLSGRAMRRLLGEAPWEPGYRGKRWAVDGLVRLDYAPAWAAACFLFERLYLAMR
ncbi:MAG: hypothetical protein HY927_13855 [Elusimicrobia bacterium]|nr:hypothetical protein [Elusimicrobiota bacterium]